MAEPKVLDEKASKEFMQKMVVDLAPKFGKKIGTLESIMINNVAIPAALKYLQDRGARIVVWQ